MTVDCKCKQRKKKTIKPVWHTAHHQLSCRGPNICRSFRVLTSSKHTISRSAMHNTHSFTQRSNFMFPGHAPSFTCNPPPPPPPTHTHKRFTLHSLVYTNVKFHVPRTPSLRYMQSPVTFLCRSHSLTQSAGYFLYKELQTAKFKGSYGKLINVPKLKQLHKNISQVGKREGIYSWSCKVTLTDLTG